MTDLLAGSRMLIGHYLPMLVLGCLGQVVPRRVMAACGSPMWGMNQSGLRPDGKPYANMFFYNGGMGGNARGDGISCLSWPSNVSSFVASLAHPGGNLTGFVQFEFPIGGKWVELLKEIAPGITRIALVIDPQNPQNINQVRYVRSVEAVAPSLAVEVTTVAVRNMSEIETGISEFAGRPAGAGHFPVAAAWTSAM